ncbi:MAG: hypothetical protein WBN96_12080, partial [Gammaproteobacteria bacterium]
MRTVILSRFGDGFGLVVASASSARKTDIIMTILLFYIRVIRVHLLRAVLRFALRAALSCVQNAPGILVRTTI